MSGVGLRSVAMCLLGGLPACCSLPDLYPTFTPGGPVGPLFGRSQGMFSSALPCCTIACAYYVAWALLPCLEHLVLGEPVDGEHTLGPVLGHLLWTCWGTGTRPTFYEGGSPAQGMGGQMCAPAQCLGGH